MKTFELRHLAEDIKIQIDIPLGVQEAYQVWKEKTAGEKIEPLEIFYAGYILSNPAVREKFKKEKTLFRDFNN